MKPTALKNCGKKNAKLTRLLAEAELEKGDTQSSVRRQKFFPRHAHYEAIEDAVSVGYSVRLGESPGLLVLPIAVM